MKNFTVEDILRGTEYGTPQSVGSMQVVPILGEDDDEFGVPDVEVRTTNYGDVDLYNRGDNPTIVPVGAGWVVDQAAQDHAIPGAALVAGGKKVHVDTAMCIQQTQGGLISREAHEMLILPVALRSVALARRHDREFNKLWDPISDFNREAGVTARGHLEFYLKQFGKQLDEFVAEFETVPNQVGAVIFVNGRVVGVERAPSNAYWRSVWTPLVRVCYGSVALKYREAVPSTRVPMRTEVVDLDDVLAALTEANEAEVRALHSVLSQVSQEPLQLTEPEGKLRTYTLRTAANSGLSGQLLLKGSTVPYASICANKV